MIATGLAAPADAAGFRFDPGPGPGSDAGASSDGESFEALRARVLAAQAEGDALRRSIRDLRDAGVAEKMAAQRIDLVRSAVDEIGFETRTRNAFLAGGYSAGWDGGFFLQDPDGRFRLDVGAHAQFRFFVSHIERATNDRARSGFENTRARLIFSGHVFTPDMRFHIQIDPTRNERLVNGQAPDANLPPGVYYLEDAWASWQLDRQWRIRVGQFKLPFNREELVDPGRQLAIERSLVNETYNLGRSEGVELQWNGENARFRLALSDGPTDDIGASTRLGVVDAFPRINTRALARGTEWSVTARWESLLAGSWEQFEDFTSPLTDPTGLMIGAAVHASTTEYGLPAGDRPNTALRDETGWYGATVDVSAEFGGSHVFASLIYHYLDRDNQPLDLLGFVLQGGWMLTSEHELFARWEAGHLKGRGINFADLNLFTVGWNWYIDGHDLKFSADFGLAESIIDLPFVSTVAGWRRDFREDEHQWLIRSQFQMMF